MSAKTETADSEASVDAELIQMESTRVRVSISTIGATIQSVQLYRDTTKEWIEVTCGYDTPAEYLEGPHYFGATAGRYANRIANGTFHLNGVQCDLVSNNGPHALHGGKEGFNKKQWKILTVSGIATEENPEAGDEDTASVALEYRSPDGEEGYPCDLRTVATFALSRSHHTLSVRYEMTNEDATRWTHVNVVSHPYWNLDGFVRPEGQPPAQMLDHTLRIDAPWYLPTDPTSIPTGEVLSVKGTAFDFLAGKPIRDAVEQLEKTPQRGIDHTFVLRTPHDASCFRRARMELTSPSGWVSMRSATNNPGIHVYTGNFLSFKTPVHGHGDVPYAQHAAVCVEAQFFPDTPNNRHFPSTVVKPKETLTQWQSFQFVFKETYGYLQ